MIERRDPLFAHNERPKHVSLVIARTFMVIKERQERMRVKCSTRSLFAKRFGAMVVLGPGSEKKWYSISEGDKMAEKMMVTLAESGHPVFRATSPLSRGVLKSKGGGNLSIHYCAVQETIKTVRSTITSMNQFSLYGAVAEMCEEYESYHDRTGRPVVRGQSSSSFVPSAIKTNMPLNDDDPAHKKLLLQRYGEPIEKLSQRDNLRISECC